MEDNRDTAVVPQAIRLSAPMKLPIDDNDPTRDITPGQGLRRYFVMGLGFAALIAMALVTALALLRR